jgi:POT family proton-dependent oligopeptide transporter
LYTLFFTEMWERFSYYGMRAILMLFMLAPVASGGLGFTSEQAGPIYAMYTSLVYLMSIPGGWLADNLLGQRKSVLYGGIVIMTGHILLAMHGLPFFYSGLGCVILGTGLLKPNISAIVGQLYEERDVRRDSGFSIFYMGINIGAFTAPLVCGFFAQHETFRGWLQSAGVEPRSSWHWGFGAAAVGMFFGLVQYLVTGHYLGDAGAQPAPVKGPADAARRRRVLGIGLILFITVAALLGGLALNRPDLLNQDNINLGYRVLLFAVVAGFFGRLFLAGSWTAAERNRLYVIAILFVAAAVFWGVFEQAGSTLTIFAEFSTDNSLLGYGFASSWWQSVNAALIILLAPVFSWLWIAMGRRNPSYGTKFAVGLLFAGLGFLWLVGGARMFTEDWDSYVASHRETILAAAARYEVEIDPGKIEVSRVNDIVANARKAGEESVLPPWDRAGIQWLFGVYLLHTIGELCLSPVGLSAMTKLAPARVVGQMMGVWFLASSIGNYLGGTVAAYYERLELTTLLLVVAGTAFVMTAIMFLLVPPIRRWTGDAQ